MSKSKKKLKKASNIFDVVTDIAIFGPITALAAWWIDKVYSSKEKKDEQ